ncbi:hypothetical protein DHEL01_v210831 [Diaporthe helianthi]|uniref:Uncharacterized protein n=1 Tax=Diaporthe helianthi TaxID=158607 RepID=A0A2P5HKJ6_DIAHE|nr:hypothetical protein DHEL01_v210831 [Diaporthe helianthi]
MDNNATCLSKQAAAYSTRFGTRYVALFDWDTLFLWNFAGKDFKRGARAGPQAYLYGHDGHAR